jgi:SAM-dependent methyltransferase
LSTKIETFRRRDDFGPFESNIQFVGQTGVLSRAAKILEIGSGKGRLLSHFFKQGYDIRGVEINREYIAASRELFGELPVSAVDSERLPAAAESMDIVMSFDVFEHIPDTDSHLREVHRVLKPGGYYLFQTPNKWTNAVFETFRWKSFTAWKVQHCSLHSFRELRKRCEQHGFSVAFHDVPLVNDFFRFKVEAYLGKPGLLLIKVINPDSLPLWLRTNFFVTARKQGREL